MQCLVFLYGGVLCTLIEHVCGNCLDILYGHVPLLGMSYGNFQVYWLGMSYGRFQIHWLGMSYVVYLQVTIG